MFDTQHIRTAQAIALTCAGLSSGLLLTVSWIVIPTIISSPSPFLLRQWSRQCIWGKTVGFPILLITSGAYAYLAWTLQAAPAVAAEAVGAPRPRAYAVAAAVVFGFIPYTRLVMLTTYRKLDSATRAADAAGAGKKTADSVISEVQARALVREWQWKNHGRAALPTIALALGMWNTFF